MKKVVTLVGARPQFVKAAVVSHEIKQNPCLDEIFVHSGQHYDYEMSSIFFEELTLPSPQHHLATGSGSHAEQTAEILVKFEKILSAENPDWVLVYGDTNTTLAGAIAAAKVHVPVAHIESGLRSFNRKMPEEINRIVTDSVSTLLFTPTDAATKHLLHEGQSPDKILQVGDVMYDAMLKFENLARRHSRIDAELDLKKGDYILATIHRAENTDDLQRLSNIIRSLEHVSEDTKVILPLHPRTKKALSELGWKEKDSSRMLLVPPVSFFDMLVLEKNACLVVTDSGGVQKEAYFHKVPCVTVRTETEWIELVNTGWNHLADPRSESAIMQAIDRALGTTGDDQELYGTGDSSAKIVAALANGP